eukprot:3000_1
MVFCVTSRNIIVYPIILLFITTNAAWLSGTTLIPRPTTNMAIGYYNGFIYLLGGARTYSVKQLLQYDIINNEFIDNGQYNLPVSIFGNGQFYTQINNYLYIINPDQGNTFVRFDLQTKTFESHWNTINIHKPVRHLGCLASTTQYLFVIGGHNYANGLLNAFQVFNLLYNIWLTNTSSMYQGRVECSCIVHPETNRLYAIGGYDLFLPLNTIESILISDNIPNQNWKYMTHNLIYAAQQSRSIIYKIYIFVIGGIYTYKNDLDSKIYRFNIDQLQVINTITGEISLGPLLNYGIYGTAAINVHDIAYAFGGCIYDDNLLYPDKWQYDILTPFPTMSPTVETLSPTMMPTVEPTFIPTKQPTIIPTSIPTNVTIIPTINLLAMSTVLYTESLDSNVDDSNKVSDVYIITIIFIIMFTVVIVCIVAIMGCKYYITKKCSNKSGKTVVELQPNIKETHGVFPAYQNVPPSAPEELQVNQNMDIFVDGINVYDGEGQIDYKYEPIKQWLYNVLDNDMENVEWIMNIFIENELDSWSVIKHLTNAELIDIGITKLGHRKKILLSIQSL